MRALSEYYLIHNLIDIWSIFILYDFCKTAVTVLNNKLTTLKYTYRNIISMLWISN